MLLVGTLEEVFLPGHPAQRRSPADPADRERWRARYMAALERMAPQADEPPEIVSEAMKWLDRPGLISALPVVLVRVMFRGPPDAFGQHGGPTSPVMATCGMGLPHCYVRWLWGSADRRDHPHGANLDLLRHARGAAAAGVRSGGR
jgi:hypothetical protein